MDPIADMLTIIRNGYLINKKEVTIVFSKFKEAVAQVLKAEGFVAEVSKKDKSLVINLKYLKSRPAITKIIRVSKPGLRVYKDKTSLPRTYTGMGIAIVSTSEGLMSNKLAKKKNLGGEIICRVW